MGEREGYFYLSSCLVYWPIKDVHKPISLADLSDGVSACQSRGDGRGGNSYVYLRVNGGQLSRTDGEMGRCY